MPVFLAALSSKKTYYHIFSCLAPEFALRHLDDYVGINTPNNMDDYVYA